MDPSLHALTATLLCERCDEARWSLAGTAGGLQLVCGGCGVRPAFRDGILQTTLAMEPAAVHERESVPTTELNPEVGGWSEAIGSFETIDPGLAAAYRSLPYGDASFRFSEPGYFANVQRFAEEFDFVTSELRARLPAGRLLDLGADGTWSTARLAASGFTCIALDITDHLRLAEVYQRTGPRYALVNADMHARVFRDESFDAITAFNVLHHSSALPRLAANIARMLRPGGVLAIVEPYVQNAAQQASFGAEQSEHGINENVYTLEHWHRVFTEVGLTLQVYGLSDSFNALFVKPGATPVESFEFADGHAAAFYGAALEVSPASATVARGQAARFTVSVRNTGRAAWASRGPAPVRLSYHLSRRLDSGLVSHEFNNPRTLLPLFVPPGETRTFDVAIELPDAGTYEVEFDLVHETRVWFAERGARTAMATLTVA